MNTLMLSVLVIGAASMMLMRREMFPEFELEIILVTVPYPGASPAEVEDGICQKLEEAVRSVDGIKKQTAIAQEGAGFLVIELKTDGPHVQKTLNEVRSGIGRRPRDQTDHDAANRHPRRSARAARNDPGSRTNSS